MEFKTTPSGRVVSGNSEEKISIPMNRYELLIKNEFLLVTLLNAALDCCELNYGGDRLTLDGSDFSRTLVALIPDTFKKKFRELRDERERSKVKEEA